MNNMTRVDLKKEAHFEVEASKELLIGHMRCDFEDGGLSNQFFPTDNLCTLKATYNLDLTEIQKEVNHIMFDTFSTFQKIEAACHPQTRLTDDNYNMFGQGMTCNYWVRLLPHRGDYNMYIKIYVADMAAGANHV